MSVKLVIHPKYIEFEPEEREKWIAGDRSNCTDSYCLKLPENYGFGEYLVGRHFQEMGYCWIHHDFDLFGANKPGKYPIAEEVLKKCLGEDVFNATRKIFPTLNPFRESGKIVLEEPDLMIYKPDFSELRFAECKRLDTKDKFNQKQAIGFYLISSLLKCDVDLFIINEKGKAYTQATVEI